MSAARKKKPRRNVMWPFRLFVILVLLLAVGWTLYNYGIRPWQEEQRASLEDRLTSRRAEWKAKHEALAAEYDPMIEDLRVDLQRLQMENRTLRENLRSGGAPTPGASPETEES